jgi:hypothetical protein
LGQFRQERTLRADPLVKSFVMHSKTRASRGVSDIRDK